MEPQLHNAVHAGVGLSSYPSTVTLILASFRAVEKFHFRSAKRNSYNFYRDDQVQTQILKSELLNYSRDPSSVVEKTAKQREKISHLVVWSKPRT